MSTLDITVDEIVVEDLAPQDDATMIIPTRVEIAKFIPAVSSPKFSPIIVYKDDKKIELGRKPEFRQECIFNDGRISTVHGEFNINCDDTKSDSDPSKYNIQLTDLGRNGCFVNGKKLGTNNNITISHGDMIGLVVPSVNHKLSSELPIYRFEFVNYLLTGQETQEHTQEVEDSTMEEKAKTQECTTEPNEVISTNEVNATHVATEEANSSEATSSSDDNEKKRKVDCETPENNSAKKQKKSLSEQDKKLLALLGATDSDMEESQEESDMANELTCPICSGIFYRAVSVVPCLHNFCSACLSSWLNPSNSVSYFGQNMNCPTCRTEIQEVRKNPTLNNLTESFLKTHPKQDRAKEEKEEMDKKDAYLNKTDLVLYKSRNNSTNHDDDSDSDSDDHDHRRRRRHGHSLSDESDSDSDDDPVGPVCDECSNPNPLDNYQCPANSLHISCTGCHCRMAYRTNDTSLAPERRQNCELCGAIYCNLYKQVTNTQTSCYVHGIHKLKEHNTIITLPSTCLNNNQAERDILIEYLRTKSISVQDVFNTCMTKVENNSYTHPSYPNFNQDSRFCQSCAYKYFTDLIYFYRADIDRNDLPNTVTSRPTCWYGKDCRTQTHNRGHAQRYNHIADNTSRQH